MSCQAPGTPVGDITQKMLLTEALRIEGKWVSSEGAGMKASETLRSATQLHMICTSIGRLSRDPLPTLSHDRSFFNKPNVFGPYNDFGAVGGLISQRMKSQELQGTDGRRKSMGKPGNQSSCELKLFMLETPSTVLGLESATCVASSHAL